MRRRDLIASFETCRGELLRFLGRRTSTPDRAEDLAQDTFLRLAAVPPELEIANPRAYIFRTAANLASDARRDEARRRARFVAQDMRGREIADPAATPERQLRARQRVAAYEAALAELSPKARAAFVMNRYDGLTHAEIALQLGVSSSMVGKYVSQALRHCRDRLAEHDARGAGEDCK